jgi:hypothetical protein
MKRISIKNWKNESLLNEALEYEAIGRRAVDAALSKSIRKNVPLVFEFKDLIYFLLPNGQISLKNPWKRKSAK